jgi:hypothetical protein
MRTLSQQLRERSTSGRIGAYFALTGAGGLVAILTDIDRLAAIAIVASLLIAIDVGLWLRNNPTVKQQQRRQARNNQIPDGHRKEATSDAKPDPGNS